MKRVDTRTYEFSHGHKPRTVAGQSGAWAFQVDGDATILWLQGTYSAALKQAKRQAKYSVKVLP
jgi:hypothetical protein